MEAYLGMIMAVGFNFAPRGWAFCNGQLLSITQNTALFSLLGTYYGGDGVTTFALPDLRGRTIVGSQGNGPGISPVTLGEMAGTNNVTVVTNGAGQATIGLNNLPAHAHTVSAVTATLNASTGTTGLSTNATAGAMLSSTPSGPAGAQMYLPSGTAPVNPVALAAASVTTGGSTDAAGGGQPLAIPVTTSGMASIMQPYTGLNYVICTEGIFPSRN